MALPEGYQELVPVEPETRPAPSYPSQKMSSPIIDKIKQAATQGGVNPDVALAIWRSEGSVENPNIKNPKSHATGIFQFMPDTWLGMGGTKEDRLNIDRQIELGIKLTKQNTDALEKRLGRPPSTWEAYLAHQQGINGAVALLSSNPNAKAADVLGSTNKVVLNGGTANMTASEFLNHIQGYVDKHSASGGTVAHAYHQAAMTQTAQSALAPTWDEPDSKQPDKTFGERMLDLFIPTSAWAEDLMLEDRQGQEHEALADYTQQEHDASAPYYRPDQLEEGDEWVTENLSRNMIRDHIAGDKYDPRVEDHLEFEKQNNPEDTFNRYISNITGGQYQPTGDGGYQPSTPEDRAQEQPQVASAPKHQLPPRPLLEKEDELPPSDELFEKKPDFFLDRRASSLAAAGKKFRTGETPDMEPPAGAGELVPVEPSKEPPAKSKYEGFTNLYPEWGELGYTPERIASLAAAEFIAGWAHFGKVLNYAGSYIAEGAALVQGFDPEQAAQMKPADIQEAFGEIEKDLIENANWYRERVKDPSLLEEIVGGATGGAVPGAVEFTLGVPYAAVEGYQEDGFAGVAKSIFKRVMLGKLLDFTSGLSTPLRAAIVGTSFGVEPFVTGQPAREVAKAVGTGALLSLGGKEPGSKTLGEAWEDFRASLPAILQSESRGLSDEAKAAELKTVQLRPSVVVGENRYDGIYGERHDDVLERHDLPVGEEERGFVGAGGKFMPRDEAKEYVKENQPYTYKHLPEGEMHAQDYAEATALGAVDEINDVLPRLLKSEKGATDMFGDAVGFLSKLHRRLHDATTIDAVPYLRRVAPTASTKGIEHASSRTHTPLRVRDLLGQVFEKDYGNKEIMERFGDLAVKDNILDGYDAFIRRGLQAHDEAIAVVKSSWDWAKQQIAEAYDKVQRFTQAAKTEKGFDRARKALDAAEKMEAELAKAQAKHQAVGKLAGQEKVHLREAKKWLSMSEAIRKAHDLGQYERDVKAGLQDAKIAKFFKNWTDLINPYLDTLYNEVKNLEPTTAREGRGKYGGARINLLTTDREEEWKAMLKDEKNPTPGDPSVHSNYRNPNMKADAFDRMAKFTGQYSKDPESILLNVLGPRLNQATKLRFYHALVDDGVAIWAKGAAKPDLLKGEPVSAFPVKIAVTDKSGHTRLEENNLWLQSKLHEETRLLLDTDMHGPKGRLLAGLNQLQIITNLSDAITHGKNMQAVLATIQGTGAWSDIVRTIPGFGTGDAMVRLAKVFEEVQKDTPEIRKEIADMAQAGMIRQEHSSHLGFMGVMPTGRWLYQIDTCARVLMNRFYQNLVDIGRAVDTPMARYDFVNQIGQYNRRLMKRWMQIARDWHIAPFIVAGRNYNRFGRRLMTGYPGVETTGWQAELQMRAVNLMRIGLLGTLPMIANAIITGSPTGRSGTPLFAVDTGKDDEKGKHIVIDLAQIIGLRRGLRRTGAEAVIEGVRQGHTAGQIFQKAVPDILQAATHPWVGPGVSFIPKAIKGWQLDIRGRMEAQRMPEGDFTTQQLGENFRAAVEAQSPLLYALARPALQTSGIDQKPDKPYFHELGGTFLKAPYSAFGVKSVYPAQSAAELLGRTYLQSGMPQGMTPDQQRTYEAKVKLRVASQRGEALERQDILDEGVLTERQIANIKKSGTRENIINIVDAIKDPKQAANVYHVASPDEREMIFPIVRGKTNRSKTLSRKAKDEILNSLDQ